MHRKLLLGGHFDFLIKWRFDKNRTRREQVVRKKNKELITLVEDKLLLHSIELEDNSEFLNLFLPCFLESEIIFTESINFFRILEEEIKVLFNGNTFELRDSKSQIDGLIKKRGFDPIHLQIYIRNFEDKILYEKLKQLKDKK